MVAVERARDVIYYEHTPAEVKKGFTGNGRAKKDTIRSYAETMFNLDLSYKGGEDVADAIAVAVCHARQRNPQALIT